MQEYRIHGRIKNPMTLNSSKVVYTGFQILESESESLVDKEVQLTVFVSRNHGLLSQIKSGELQPGDELTINGHFEQTTGNYNVFDVQFIAHGERTKKLSMADIAGSKDYEVELPDSF